MLRPSSIVWLLTLAAATAEATLRIAPAQDDLRDTVTMTNGRILRGRVATPYAGGEVVVMQGGKRVRAPRAKVANVELVADRVEEFFVRRQRHKNSPRALRYLVDWAASKDLQELARLQALELVLLDDTDDEMHEAAGHRRRGKNGEWRWLYGKKWIKQDQLVKAMLEKPLRLPGERFALTCDAGLLTNVRALLDLERLGVAFFKEFGRDLQLKEVLKRIEIRTFRNIDEFPKWGFRARPYFEPPPHADLGRTFYSGPAPTRPEDLFFIGTQGLLYRTMIGEVSQQNSRDRACAWLEVGLGMHMQMRMQGDAGFASPAAKDKLDLRAISALNRDYRLTHVVHLPMYGSFYLTDDLATSTNWSASAMFVTWLLDDGKQPKTRAPFLRYVRAALAGRKGDSSSVFDKIMGTRIEELDEPWRDWLYKLSRK
ncbi:MAG: hypothetical protein AB8H80_13275 [Planctomycetota bacterium]